MGSTNEAVATLEGMRDESIVADAEMRSVGWLE